MIVRYVRPLTENQRHTLAEIMKHDAIPRARVRAHGILLSSQGMRIKEIAKIYQVDRDTVATWIKKWEQSGMASLYDQPRSGRPPKLTPEEKDLARQYIKEDPRCLKQVVERLSQKTAKRLSISSLKRLAKKAGLRWKRVRKSVKSLRDPEEFTQCQRELEALQKQEDQGKIDLYYFDESGFTLDPYIPYAWHIGKYLSSFPILVGVSKFCIISEFKDWFESESRAPGALITSGMSPLSVYS